jgi:hypothetical protein
MSPVCFVKHVPSTLILLPPCATPPQRFPGQVHPTAPLPRKPSAGCASTVAGSASTVRVAGPPALALAPSQVHPTASTKTVRRMRLDRCWHAASPWLLLDHSALALAPSQVHPTASTKTVRRMRLDRCWIRFPVVVCWTPPWLWHPARFTPQLPRKPSAGCASTVAGSASTVRVAGPPALALAPSQVHPTASTKTVRRMRLDCCWIRFPVVVAGPPPWLWHPARFTPQLPRKPSAGCASTVEACPSPWLLLDHSALALAPSQVHPTARSLNSRRPRPQ